MSRSSARTSPQTSRPDRDVGDGRRQHGVAEEPRIDVRADRAMKIRQEIRDRHRQAGDEGDVVAQPRRVQAIACRSAPAGRPGRRRSRRDPSSSIGPRESLRSPACPGSDSGARARATLLPQLHNEAFHAVRRTGSSTGPVSWRAVGERRSDAMLQASAKFRTGARWSATVSTRSAA